MQKRCKGQSEVLNLCQSPASLITYLLLTLHHFSWTANWFSPIVLKIWLSYVLEISIKLCHLITPEWEKKNIKLRFQPHKKPENLWLKMKESTKTKRWKLKQLRESWYRFWPPRVMYCLFVAGPSLQGESCTIEWLGNNTLDEKYCLLKLQQHIG